MLTSALLVAAFAVQVADLPPGAVLRLGDSRWRAGYAINDIALSPDGKQFATSQYGGYGMRAVTVWDADTGRPLRSNVVNDPLFRGMAWGKSGGFVVVRRADPGVGEKPGRLVLDDFRAWDFADPKAAPPPRLPITVSNELGAAMVVEFPKDGPEYVAFAVAASGGRVAAGHKSKDGKYRIDVFDLKPTASAAKLSRVRSLDFDGEVKGVILSHDGRTVAAFRPHPTERHALEVRAWNVETGKAGEWFRTDASPKQVALSPDGRTLAIAFVYNEVRLVDPMTGKNQGVIPRPENPDGGSYGGLAFTPDGKRLVVSDGFGAFVADVATEKVIARLEGHAGTVTGIAVSADGKRIATADWFGLVRLWDAQTLRSLTPATGHTGSIEHAELSPDGKRLLTFAGDETIRIWDITTGKELRAFAEVPARVVKVSRIANEPTFTPDGLAVVFSKGERLAARDILTGLEVPLPAELREQTYSSVAFSPDGKAVLTNRAFSRVLEVWDWPTGKKRFTVEASADPQRPGFSPDGSVVFASAVTPERWDAKTGKALPPAWDAKKDARPVATISPRPNPRLIIRGVNDELQVAETGTLKPVPRYRLTNDGDDFDYPIFSPCALCPTGRQLAEARDNTTASWEVWVFEAASGWVRRKLTGHRGEVQVLGFTPDGSRLLTAGGDHTVLVWDVRPQSMPLPEAVRRETDAAKLWATMSVGKAEAAYLAMARLAAEPDAAVKTARKRIRPATATDPPDHAAQRLADGRAIELLESLGTPASRALLKELAGGDTKAWRTQEAGRALERAVAAGYNPK
jgi:WD40 repeat protein